MKMSLLKSLSSRSSHAFNSIPEYRKIRVKYLRRKVGHPCYLCGVTTTRQPVPAGTKPKPTHITLEHYVPVWFLKAIGLPEGIIHVPNFRVCCLKCNYERSFRTLTVGDLRLDVGDELVDKLMEVSGVHLPDYYHQKYKHKNKYKLKTPAK